ncbi:HD domain-containing protein [Pontibacter sp. G13]|uniref:CCA tRNA nucleotidyltransferase n=1 Tax=Pontibacter sp. G13 TaxID=3074898 RepID=UPI00288941B5|nr:HD domain-containing protein [Pontibacter sp. G13]WNJ19381.1 HD domain-containing protein [Pontibacter sp. G13]
MKLQEALDEEVFDILAQASKSLGIRSYVIGGYVRDYLMRDLYDRHESRKDIDIVVEGRGIDLARKFGELVGAKDVVVYENFGTAMVPFQDYSVEFVGARKESYQRNSRKPIVEEGTLEDDQLRRDFTINALSISLNEEDFAHLHDPFEGVQDLKDGIIRTPTDPDITFSDDPLRMIRAIRFATRFGFHIEERTYKAIIKNRQRITIVSKERINDELNKIIMTEKPSRGFDLLFRTGLLKLVFPELHNMHGIDYVNGRGHKDNFYHTLQVLDNISIKSDNLWLRWVAILHDIAKPLTKRYHPQHGWTFHGHEDRGGRLVPKIFRNMKLPLNEHMKYVQKLVFLHQRPIALVNEEVSDSAIRRLVVDAGEDLNDLLEFCRADITSKNEKKVTRFLRNYEVLEKRIHEVEQRDNLRNWQPPITGNEIMETFKLPPSRAVGQIKTEIREAILDGVIPNEVDAARAFMMEIAPKYLEPKP